MNDFTANSTDTATNAHAKASTFARHTKLSHKANLAKELACQHTGHTLPFVATQTDRVEARTPYMGFGVIGAGRCYLHHQQHGSSCLGLTEFYLAFCCYLQQQFFKWASVPGGRFSTPPTTPSPVRYRLCYHDIKHQQPLPHDTKAD